MTSRAQNVLLSIITVVRNDRQRLEETISSLESFYDDIRFEHIVIDGDSSDHTRLFLEEMCRHKNFKYHSEPDDGIYDAMNRGTRRSIGYFTLYLNCGDKIVASPDQIYEWLSPFTISNNTDIMCFRSRLVSGSKVIHLAPKLAWPHQLPTSHQAMVFSGNFTRTNPYNMRYKIAADFDLYLKADRGRVIFWGGEGCLTEIEADGFASTNPIQSYGEYLDVVKSNLGGIVKWRALSRILARAVGVIFLKKFLPRNWMLAIRGYM